MRLSWRRPFGRSGNEKCEKAESSETALGRAASKAIRLREFSPSTAFADRFFPLFQSLLQLHTAGCLEQDDVSVPQLAAQPLPCIFSRGHELSADAARTGSINNRLRQPAHSEYRIDTLLRHVTARVAMH